MMGVWDGIAGLWRLSRWSAEGPGKTGAFRGMTSASMQSTDETPDTRHTSSTVALPALRLVANNSPNARPSPGRCVGRSTSLHGFAANDIDTGHTHSRNSLATQADGCSIVVLPYSQGLDRLPLSTPLDEAPTLIRLVASASPAPSWATAAALHHTLTFPFHYNPPRICLEIIRVSPVLVSGSHSSSNSSSRLPSHPSIIPQRRKPLQSSQPHLKLCDRPTAPFPTPRPRPTCQRVYRYEHSYIHQDRSEYPIPGLPSGSYTFTGRESGAGVQCTYWTVLRTDSQSSPAQGPGDPFSCPLPNPT
ncbi:hypothetical protein M431DRAFT_531080 [Trichoderma harzianum CBS 226.95]|uniref:Uncharacterized protein n=1 Tax=Trichoderma harzianum CBS 226.95 TaxID=983964 RepID=A0A2T4AD51_TRIHA|nr:hypothetical protein M431DRAFT_531080 [Trichoderma harzianum CBS 226.95]PTB55015.1 hypothetical protein M431DRAFT_531080 [Trichoderma harzianum CBS 226.95]